MGFTPRGIELSSVWSASRASVPKNRLASVASPAISDSTASALAWLEAREIGITVTTIANWVFAAIVVQGSEIVLNTLGGSVMFYFFAACCFVGLFIVFFFTPETRRVSLEDMEQRLRKGTRLKRIGA